MNSKVKTNPEARTMLEMSMGAVRHFKGKFYTIWLTATNVDDLSECVIYVEADRHGRPKAEGKTWVRKADEFMSLVPEGKDNPTGQKYRFEVVEKLEEIKK